MTGCVDVWEDPGGWINDEPACFDGGLVVVIVYCGGRVEILFSVEGFVVEPVNSFGGPVYAKWFATTSSIRYIPLLCSWVDRFFRSADFIVD